MIPIKDNIPTDRFVVVTLGLIIVNLRVHLLAIRLLATHVKQVPPRQPVR